MAPKPTEESAGARLVLSGLEAPSGNWLLGLKGRTLDVRVEVGDAGSAGDLIRRLVGNVEAEGVSGIAPTHGRPYVLGAASVVGGTA